MRLKWFFFPCKVTGSTPAVNNQGWLTRAGPRRWWLWCFGEDAPRMGAGCSCSRRGGGRPGGAGDDVCWSSQAALPGPTAKSCAACGKSLLWAGVLPFVRRSQVHSAVLTSHGSAGKFPLAVPAVLCPGDTCARCAELSPLLFGMSRGEAAQRSSCSVPLSSPWFPFTRLGFTMDF